MKSRFSVLLLLFASSFALADTPLWEPGKVIAVEQVSTPAKTPDASCRTVPRGTTPPPRCRPAYLRAEQFWRVTVEVGNKRYVVRPYRETNLLNALSQEGIVYVDPNVTAASTIEVAVLSSKAMRLRADQGPGMPAMVDSQELISPPGVSVKVQSPAPSRPKMTASFTSNSKVVLLEKNDFLDMETQQFQSQDIGGGAVVYSFTGDSSPTKIGSNPPILLVLADNEAAMGNPELARVQVSKGVRQLAYSPTNHHSVSPLPIIVTPVSATLRKVTIQEPLAPGEYVILLENSDRGFLFNVR